MIIVITPERAVKNETVIINQLFQEGLDLLHIRKPFLSKDEMKDFIEEIDYRYHPQLVLHNHYDLSAGFNISRFHYRETDRVNGLSIQDINNRIISTSVHNINTYNNLGNEWEYSLISPVFPSISKKGYGENTKMLEDIRYRNNPDVKLIALGGIHENNIREVGDTAVDGIALLGAIWENNQPLHIFKKCRNVLLQ